LSSSSKPDKPHFVFAENSVRIVSAYLVGHGGADRPQCPGERLKAGGLAIGHSRQKCNLLRQKDVGDKILETCLSGRAHERAICGNEKRPGFLLLNGTKYFQLCGIVGDNDILAAEVAHLVDAELLIILSDIDGLFTEDPRKNPAATLIPLIPDITKEIEERAGVSTTFEGTGGMATKIRAAKKVSEYGVATLILNGQEAGLLPQVLAGGPGGSLFLAKERRFTSRKHWIAFTLRPRGTLTLDSGAVEALARRGKSLLASGILDVSGSFDTGDAVSCLDQDGKEFAKGLVNFSSDTLARIKGLKTTEIQQRLGQQEYEEVIHRDNLVIL